MTSTRLHDRCDARSILQHWLLGLLLCCGGAIVWTLLLGWIGDCATWWFNRDRMHESRQVFLSSNGEPYVLVQRYGNNGRGHVVEFQTVDGQRMLESPQELALTNKSWQASPFATDLSTTTFVNWRRDPQTIYQWVDAPEPLPWSLSLMRFVDGDQYSEYGSHGPHWYFRGSRYPGGTGFFEGFDYKTKQRIGFIGLHGFSETIPPAVDQFPVWDNDKSKRAKFITQFNEGHSSLHTAALVLNAEGDSREYGLWLITPQRDRIFVINLTRRSVAATRVLSEKLLGISSHRDETGRSRNVAHALLWEDRLEIVSPTLKTLREIRFPTELRGKVGSLSEFQSGEFEDSYTDRSPDPKTIPAEEHFIRFNDRGETTLRKTVKVPRDKPTYLWSAELYLPPLSLMPINAVKWLAEDHSMSNLNGGSQPFRRPDEPLTWSIRLQSLRIIISLIGWPFWLTLLSGFPFAALCAWRQRTLPVSNFDRIAWPLLLCVFGIVGWMAFLTHRRWPVRKLSMSC